MLTVCFRLLGPFHFQTGLKVSPAYTLLLWVFAAQSKPWVFSPNPEGEPRRALLYSAALSLSAVRLALPRFSAPAEVVHSSMHKLGESHLRFKKTTKTQKHKAKNNTRRSTLRRFELPAPSKNVVRAILLAFPGSRRAFLFQPSFPSIPLSKPVASLALRSRPPLAAARATPHPP